MDCVYINLTSRPDRRQAIEDSFDRHRAAGWTLSRFEAVDTAQVAQANVQGAVSAAEKACFVSHRTLIRQHLPADGPLMVLEDDAMFGSRTCQVIETSLARIPEDAWDIVFTDIALPDVGQWPDLVRLRRQFDQTGAFKLLGLGRLHFAGSTSYVLNRRSKRLLTQVLDEATRIDAPYDIHLRSLVHQGRLKGFVLFPFVTTVSHLAEQTSIQASGGALLDAILNGFRRAMWADRDLDRAAADLAPLREACGSRETAVFGTLFEAMLSDQIPRK